MQIYGKEVGDKKEYPETASPTGQKQSKHSYDGNEGCTPCQQGPDTTLYTSLQFVNVAVSQFSRVFGGI